MGNNLAISENRQQRFAAVLARLIKIAHKTCCPEMASVGGWIMCKALMCLHKARLETGPILAPVVSQTIPVG